MKKAQPKPVLVPHLETERFVLRQLTEGDMDFIYEIFSRAETNLFVADESVRNMSEARELYDTFISPKPHLFRLGLFLRKNGKPIGTIGLYGIRPEDSRAVMGFDLLKEYWGHGYMTEAGRALIDFAFSQMGLNRIQASADADNGRSLSTLERMGFTKEGVMRQKDFYKGAFHDDVVYSMLAQDWLRMAKRKGKRRAQQK